jgi:putative serine protease PepD
VLLGGAGSLHPASFGRLAAVRVGEIVLAMGNPLGLTGTVTDGIVSATGRTVSEGQGSSAVLISAIQTSAAINPGNSGGALVNLAGQVIGIPTLAATSSQLGGAAAGIGFAIPSDTVTSIAGQLIATGKVGNSGRASLGISAQTVADSGLVAGRAAIGPGRAQTRRPGTGPRVTQRHRVHRATDLGQPHQLNKGGVTGCFQVPARRA